MPIHIDEMNTRIEAPSRGRGTGSGAAAGSLPPADVAKEELRAVVRELIAEELERRARREALR